MNIWNKVLLILITLTSLAFFVLASNRYMLQKEWEETIQAKVKQFQTIQGEVAKLRSEIYGEPMGEAQDWDSLCLVDQMARIRSLLDGNVWVNCKALPVSKNQNQVTTSFILPTAYDSNGVIPAGTVYVFDSGTSYLDDASLAAGGQEAGTSDPLNPSDEAEENSPMATGLNSARFLGIFEIQSVRNSEISLVAANFMSDEEVAVVDQSIKKNNSWIVLPNRPPIDSPDDVAFFMQSGSEVYQTLTEEDQKYFERTSFDFPVLASMKPKQKSAGIANKGIEIAPDQNTSEEVSMDDEIIDDDIGISIDDDLGIAMDDSASKRTPLDFAWLIHRGYTNRDLQSVAIARKETTLDHVNTILLSQLVLMGSELTEEQKLVVDMNAYQMAVQEHKQSVTFASFYERETKLTADLAKRVQERDLVQSRLEKVNDLQLQLQSRIDLLLQKNNELAIAIAMTQFEALKKIMGQQVQTVPVSEGDKGPAYSFSKNMAGI